MYVHQCSLILDVVFIGKETLAILEKILGMNVLTVVLIDPYFPN